MMHHDPIAVFLRGTIEASLAGPMVALQNRVSMSAEVFPVVMTYEPGFGSTAESPEGRGRGSAMAHAAGDDIERATGAKEYRLNSLAARPRGEVGERRTHRESLNSASSKWSVALETRPAKSRDFSIFSTLPPKNTRPEGVQDTFSTIVIPQCPQILGDSTLAGPTFGAPPAESRWRTSYPRPAEAGEEGRSKRSSRFAGGTPKAVVVDVLVSLSSLVWAGTAEFRPTGRWPGWQGGE